MKVFSRIGIFYAIGDYLEMLSMGGLDGAAYQVLLQSKLVITAIMMIAIKGRTAQQTRSQWAALISVTLGMTIFMVSQSNGGGGSSKSTNLGAVGVVLMKVISSCFSAVTADTALKAFKELPLYIQLSQLFLSWGIVSVILTVFFEPAVLFSATTFFAGWNIGTVLVVISFAIKTVITMTLLKVLDSVMKNIGEAVAVLVIYMAQVVLPVFAKPFQMETFLAMALVVMTVTTYMFLKQDLEASRKGH